MSWQKGTQDPNSHQTSHLQRLQAIIPTEIALDTCPLECLLHCVGGSTPKITGTDVSRATAAIPYWLPLPPHRSEAYRHESQRQVIRSIAANGASCCATIELVTLHLQHRVGWIAGNVNAMAGQAIQTTTQQLASD